MSNFLLKHSRSSTIWMKPMKLFFSFSFLLQFVWLLFFIKLLICFRIPKTLSSAWTCPQLNLRCEYYPPSCLFFTSTWSMTPFPILISVGENLLFFSYPYSLLLITTPSTFAWYPRDWYACYSVPEPAKLPAPWEEKPQLVPFALSWINSDYMWQVCDIIFLSELRGVFHFSILLKSHKLTCYTFHSLIGLFSLRN